ncbi:hypothetical protein Y032_0040g190 [Ancylostoma ceylanicum]|uniref:Uncharacterized protein n=1 Tax=Ancylostoma ceylanicum TaxID=53326 RepID=A0A016UIK2_9BILA|nr:hypothetical protein Y032_0040g190 [Ancylostoma ceylanicum]
MAPFWEDVEGRNDGTETIMKEAAKKLLIVDLSSEIKDRAYFAEFSASVIDRVAKPPVYCTMPMCLNTTGQEFYTGSDHHLLRAKFFSSHKAEKASKYKKRSPKPTINWDLFTTLAGFWEDTDVDNIDEEYERLIQHLRDSAKKAEGSTTTKRQWSHETLELIRQRLAARAAGNYQLTSELAKRCREAIKEYLKERRAAVLAETTEARRRIRNTHRDFGNRKTKMTALRRKTFPKKKKRRIKIIPSQ